MSATLRAVPSAGLIGVMVLMTLSVHAQPLDLADRPLFTGETVDPNIMVAVDDSASMDYEFILPTFDGLLYWNFQRNDSYRNGRFNTTTKLNDDDVAPYSYLFPNGCSADGKRLKCDDQHNALPPLPKFAFARSPQYNKAYFDPRTDYEPWVGYDPADATEAQYEPALAPNLRVDLTQNRRTQQRFQVRCAGRHDHSFRDTVLPAGRQHKPGRQEEPYGGSCV